MVATRPRKKSAVADHRPRVARERRARTRARILAAAMDVFAAKGPDAPVIDDFIRAAGIARGTFYAYFTSTDELLDATSAWLEDSLIHSIQAEISAMDDPVLRLATGVRLWLRWSIEDRAWSTFVVRSRFRGPLVERQLTADLRLGLASGAFKAPSVSIARDLVVGTILETMRRIVDEKVPASLPEDLARLILRALGLSERLAAKAIGAPAPRIKRPNPALP
jgi:AcrR family transcriptional regulator